MSEPRHMAPDEARALAELATGAVRDGIRRIEGVHDAVARRSWRPVGVAGAPSHRLHDAIAAGVYGSVRAGFTAGGAVAGAALSGAARVAGWRPLSQTPGGSSFLGVLNGFAGDRLERQRSDLALPMTFRRSGRDLPHDRAQLGDALPDATGDVAVFVHGLVETDRSWWWGAQRYYGDPAVSYGSLLAADLGTTPLYLRYNTGLPVSDNGRRLTELLDHALSAWPVPLERLTLVGHSMGGLAIRSACHAGTARGHDWVSALRHAVYLGTPHLGAPLARASMALGSVLASLPEVRPFATILERPSAGIRDLRHGTLVDPDPADEDPGDWFGDQGQDIPLLPDCRHHAVAAAVTHRGDSVIDRLLGDLLVQTTSASGRGGRRRRVDFIAEEGVSLGGLHHFSLLNHPAVYEQIRTWLGERPAGR